MTYNEFIDHFTSLHPRPDKPYLTRYLFRADLILLVLAAIGGLVFSASRTYTLIAEQSGPVIAAFAVFALEFSLAGLILSQARKVTGWFMRALRASAAWITILLLLFILVVTNASYEIQQVNLMVPEEVLKWVLVFFLGVLVPMLVFINLENLSSSIPEYVNDFRQDTQQYYTNLSEWNDQLAASWEDEQSKEFVQDVPLSFYSKQDRREFVRERLLRGEKLNKTKIAERFGVSTTTISNDIKELTSKELTSKSDVESVF